MPYEGWRTKVYLDSVGKPTVGMGHLLTDDQREDYPVGATVPQSLLSKWTAEDLQVSLDAARKQAKELDLENDDRFVLVLASVNFQLGIYWRSKFPSTWNFIKEKQYEKAVSNILQSRWHNQTPTRTSQFMAELYRLESRPGKRLLIKILIVVAASVTIGLAMYELRKISKQ